MRWVWALGLHGSDRGLAWAMLCQICVSFRPLRRFAGATGKRMDQTWIGRLPKRRLTRRDQDRQSDHILEQVSVV